MLLARPPGCHLFQDRHAVKIELRNIGPVRRAEFDLAPLTMLVGKNNTGKSMAMMAMYAALGDAHQSALLLYQRVDAGRIAKQYEDEPASQAIIDLVSRASKPTFDELPNDLVEHLGDAARRVLMLYGAVLADELQRATGIPLSRLRRSGAPSRAQVSISVRHSHPAWRLTVSLGTGKPHVTWQAPSPDKVWELITDERWTFLRRRSGRPIPSRRHPVEEVLWQCLSTIFRELPRTAFYLPATRSGIMAIQRDLVGELVRRSSTSPSDEVTGDHPMTGVMADFLSTMVNLKLAGGAFDDAAALLEGEVLHGSVELRGEESGARQAVYVSLAGEFPMRSVSSMVQELSPVVLYLRHVLRESDLLLFEEPEAHLHPQAQRALAGAMVRLVNRGLRICMTTHSDFLVEQINNAVAAHRIGQDAAKLGIASTLDPQHLRCYLFQPDDDGTAVRRLGISPEDGVSEEAFSDVVKELYEESLRIERTAER
jgi:predicted ATPase